MNINSVKTGSTVCKPSGGLPMDSTRAVRKAFSVELSQWLQIFVHYPPVCTQMSKKTHLKGRELKHLPWIQYCALSLWAIYAEIIHSNLVQNHPQIRWTGQSFTATHLSLFNSFSEDMIGEEQWVMATDWYHQFCHYCGEAIEIVEEIFALLCMTR